MGRFRHSLFFTLVYGSLCIIALIGLPCFLMPRPAVLSVMLVWVRFTRWCLKACYGVESEVRGLHNLPETPCLIAMKHQSTYDTVFPMLWLHQPAYVMKRELLKAPFYGWYCRKWGMIPIDRSSGVAALKAMCRHAKNSAQLGRQIVIFPEGTRRKPSDPPRYLPGIAAVYNTLNRPCVPIALNSGLFWPGAPEFAAGNNTPRRIVFDILPPIQPGLNRRQFMEKLQQTLEPASQALLQQPANPTAT